MHDTDLSLEKLQQRIGWLARDPGNKPLYRQCADAALALHRYELLLDISERARKADPADPAPSFDRANAQIGLRDYRAALATLAEIQTSSSEQQHAVAANLSLCLFCLGEHEQALPHLKRMYEQGLRTPSMLFMLVRSHHALGQLADAVEIAKANTEPAAHDAALAGAYALLFLDAEDVGAATRWATTAMRLDPRSVDGNVAEGTLAILRLQTERAQKLFDTALEIAPNTGRAWVGLGALAMLREDLPRAEAHFQHGLKFMPEYVGGWHMLAWSQLMQGHLQPAQTSLERALELDRNFAETHGALAALDAMKGDTASAERRLAIARRLDPKCSSAQFAAALLADPTLRSEKPQAILQRALLGMAEQHQSPLGRLLLQRRR